MGGSSSTTRHKAKDSEGPSRLVRAVETLQHDLSLGLLGQFSPEDQRRLVRALESVKALAESAARAGSASEDKSHPRTKVSRLVAFTDGASRGNPGEAACAVVLLDDKNEELLRRSKKLGVTTNNVAEYEGVLLALELAGMLGARRLEICLDSELVVRQLKGEYKVKHPTLKPLYERARMQMVAFEHVAVVHVPRQENKLADGLANDELDGKAREP